MDEQQCLRDTFEAKRREYVEAIEQKKWNRANKIIKALVLMAHDMPQVKFQDGNPTPLIVHGGVEYYEYVPQTGRFFNVEDNYGQEPIVKELHIDPNSSYSFYRRGQMQLSGRDLLLEFGTAHLSQSQQQHSMGHRTAAIYGVNRTTSLV